MLFVKANKKRINEKRKRNNNNSKSSRCNSRNSSHKNSEVELVWTKSFSKENTFEISGNEIVNAICKNLQK